MVGRRNLKDHQSNHGASIRKLEENNKFIRIKLKNLTNSEMNYFFI